MWFSTRQTSVFKMGLQSHAINDYWCYSLDVNLVDKALLHQYDQRKQKSCNHQWLKPWPLSVNKSSTTKKNRGWNQLMPSFTLQYICTCWQNHSIFLGNYTFPMTMSYVCPTSIILYLLRCQQCLYLSSSSVDSTSCTSTDTCEDWIQKMQGYGDVR